MLFRKEKKKVLIIDGGSYCVDKFVFDYIWNLRKELSVANSKINDLTYTNEHIKKSIDKLTPIMEHPKIKPAISSECGCCKYVVRNLFGEVIGCRKDIVCEDFVKED